jgi:arsenate reductase
MQCLSEIPIQNGREKPFEAVTFIKRVNFLHLAKTNTMQIYHNPRCRKSRETLSILEAKGIKPDIILYLKDTPSKEALSSVLKKLNMQASQIIRKGEQIYKDNFKGKELSEEEWLDALVQYPKLIERPIVIKDDKAVLGRPPENVLDLI